MKRMVFTFIEMLIVIVVMAVLVLIVLPGLLGQAGRASHAVAKKGTIFSVEVSPLQVVKEFGGYTQVPNNGAAVVFVIRKDMCTDEPMGYVEGVVFDTKKYWGVDTVGSVTLVMNPKYGNKQEPYWVVTIRHPNSPKK